MTKQKDFQQDETLLVTLEQLGKTLDMMQALFIRMEAYVTAPVSKTTEGESLQLTAEIPADRTVH